MSYVEGSLGAMLQGISQQPARIRVEGQVSDQVNYDSDVVEGITSRPGTDRIGKALDPSPRAFADFDFKGTTYLAAYSAGNLTLQSLTGDTVTTMPVSGDRSYVGTDMVFYPSDADDRVYVVNRSTVVALDPTVAGRPFHAGLISCLGGQFSRTYTVTIKSGVTTVTGSYTTPDGTTTGDADKTASSFIIAEIKTALDAAPLPAGMTTTVVEDVLLVNYTAAMTITVDDGEYGAVLRAVAEDAKDVTHLPRYAQHGHVVRVTGSTRAEDDYFLRFESDTTMTDGQGFGDTGVWREAADPDQAHAFDLTTMPHQLTITGGAATFGTVPWLDRRVGSTESNPSPSFVGKAIRDLAGFENRIVVIAGARPVMTRTDNPLDFYKKSATVDTDDDPIDFKSTASKGNTLDWIVPFNKNLLLVSDPGKAQFVITGGGLTPKNASMVLTTEFDVDSGARPAATGNTVLLGYRAGENAGVYEFFTDGAANLQNAEPLTSGQSKLIPGTIQRALSVNNFNRILFQATGTDDLFVYRYLWSNRERVQSSWSKMSLGGPLAYMFSRGSDVYFVVGPSGAFFGGSPILRMDLNRAGTLDVGYHVTLDYKQVYTVPENRRIAFTHPDAVVIQGTGCAEPGQYVPYTPFTVTDAYGYELDDLVPAGATVHLGVPVTRVLAPTMPLYKDFRERVVTNAKLLVARFLIHLGRGSDLKITQSGPYRDDTEFYPRRFPMDDNPLDPDRSGTAQYTLNVPWREQTSRSTLTITSEDARPDTILEIEWEGQVHGVRRRI